MNRPLGIKEIEAAVFDGRAFAGLENRPYLGNMTGILTRQDRYTIRNNARRINEVIEMLGIWERDGIGDQRRPTLLEVGIGYGELILSVAKAFPSFELYGVEHPGRKYLNDRAYLDRMTVSGIRVVPGDLEAGLPFPDSRFDAVLFCEVLEHLSPVKVPAILSELSRIVKTNGAVIVASPNLSSLYNRLIALKGGSIFEPAIPGADGTFGHIRLYTVKELAEISNRSHLRLERVRFSNSMLIDGLEKGFLVLAAKQLQAFSAAFFPALSCNWTVLLSKQADAVGKQ